MQMPIDPTSIELSPDMFSDVKLIGTGGFSHVYKAKHLGTNMIIALKVFEKQTCDKALIDSEYSVHRILDHPFIVKCFGMISTTKFIILLMEYVEGVSLIEKVNTKHGLRELESRKLFIQLLSALKYMHENGIIHRDLKLENMIVDVYGNLRLIDFGLSKQRSPIMKTHCGSYPYCAPELFTSGLYTSAIDIWSMGVILYGMICGALPFDDPNLQILIHKIMYTEPKFDFSFTPEGVDLISKMLSKDPTARIPIAKIEYHPWITEVPVLLEFLDHGWILQWKGPDPDLPLSVQIESRMNFCERLHKAIDKSMMPALSARRRISAAALAIPAESNECNRSVERLPVPNFSEHRKSLGLTSLFSIGLKVRKGNSGIKTQRTEVQKLSF